MKFVSREHLEKRLLKYWGTELSLLKNILTWVPNLYRTHILSIDQFRFLITNCVIDVIAEIDENPIQIIKDDFFSGSIVELSRKHNNLLQITPLNGQQVIVEILDDANESWRLLRDIKYNEIDPFAYSQQPLIKGEFNPIVSIDEKTIKDKLQLYWAANQFHFSQKWLKTLYAYYQQSLQEIILLLAHCIDEIAAAAPPEFEEDFIDDDFLNGAIVEIGAQNHLRITLLTGQQFILLFTLNQNAEDATDWILLHHKKVGLADSF